MTSGRSACGVALAGIASMSACVDALGLSALRISQAEIQAQLRARDDCIAWYTFFGEVPDGLTFVPAPEKDELVQTEGGLEGQCAMRIFHGMLRGSVPDIPETGFTLCCSYCAGR